jgi:hypothetical protein
MEIEMNNVAEFIEAASRNGIGSFGVSDRKIADLLRVKHIRSGKIDRQASKEGSGVAVYAYGFDSLGNVIALCKDGIVRQFFR